MAHFLCKKRLDFLSNEQREKLSQHFKRSNANAMPHQLAVLLGLEYSDALIILSVLESDGLCENKLLIYHTCAEPPVGAIKFGIGFPRLPWVCPECEETIEDARELCFDVMAVTDKTIEFI
jgi:hypothetical protein